MALRILVDGKEVHHEFIRFSDGSSNIKIEPKKAYISATVELLPETPCDSALWEILLATDALWRLHNSQVKYSLVLNYLPHARADRVFEEGNALPLRLFVNVFKWFDTVYLTDPHSDAWKEWAVDSNVVVVPQSRCVLGTVDLQSLENLVLVAPDKGALTKVEDLSRLLGAIGYGNRSIHATKERCIQTGRILSTKVEHQDLTGSDCLIVDDISDGGGTFLGLSQILREMNPKSIQLYVTHGIFSRGLEPFKGIIDKIHVDQVIGSYITQEELENFNKGEK